MFMICLTSILSKIDPVRSFLLLREPSGPSLNNLSNYLFVIAPLLPTSFKKASMSSFSILFTTPALAHTNSVKMGTLMVSWSLTNRVLFLNKRSKSSSLAWFSYAVSLFLGCISSCRGNLVATFVTMLRMALKATDSNDFMRCVKHEANSTTEII